MAKGIGSIIKKYGVVVLFPSCTGSFIYLDYRRTQKFLSEKETYQEIEKSIKEKVKLMIDLKYIPRMIGIGLTGMGTWYTFYFIDSLERPYETSFRDKSALFGKVKKPDELPSW